MIIINIKPPTPQPSQQVGRYNGHNACKSPADCNERQEARNESATAQALMKPNESKLIKDFVGALLSVFFYRDPCCTMYIVSLVSVDSLLVLLLRYII